MSRYFDARNTAIVVDLKVFPYIHIHLITNESVSNTESKNIGICTTVKRRSSNPALSTKVLVCWEF